MTNKGQWKWAFLLIIVIGILFYYLGIRKSVEQAYFGEGPTWLNFIIQAIYPRFFVEKHRFDLSFFLQKADMVIWRSSIVVSLLILFGESIYRFVFKDTTITSFNYHFLRWAFYISAPFYYWDWYVELVKLGNIKEFYRPVLLLTQIFPEYPSPTVLGILFSTMIIANLLILANKYVRLAGLYFAVVFIVQQGLFLSFHKIDHGFATYIYCLMIFPLMAPMKPFENSQPINAWPLQLIWLSIALSYFMSGLEKLTISGWHWVTPDNLKSYLSTNHTYVGNWVAQYDWLCIIIACSGILFQLGFVSIMYNSKLRWIFVPAGIIFHFMTGILFQITGLLSPWQLVYIFFIDWGKAWDNFSSKGFLYKTIKTKKG